MYLLFLLAMVSLENRAHAQEVQPTEPTPILDLDFEEQDAFMRINELRALSGVAPLTLDSSLLKAARAHANVMDANQFLTHDETGLDTSVEQRIKNAGGSYSSEGENVACGHASGIGTFNQWLHSPGHLENMLRADYQSMGIARAGTHSQSSHTCPYFWTADFGGN